MNQCLINTTRIPCRYCAISLQDRLDEIEGIEIVKVDYETDTIKIYYNTSNLDIEKLINVIEESGYRVKRIKYK